MVAYMIRDKGLAVDEDQVGEESLADDAALDRLAAHLVELHGAVHGGRADHLERMEPGLL